MAVDKNPYKNWENLRSNSDYRNTDTQITSLVRQQLSQSTYLRTSNRVNPGPYRNLRAKIADSKQQIPHPLGSEDLWGWQQWTKEDRSLDVSTLASGLYEQVQDISIEGKDYSPLGEVGGSSS